jgi:hypothetical protein
MGWIGVDLDGTLAHYESYAGEEIIGRPITAMKNRVLEWIKNGKEVKILTARAGTPKGKSAVESWLKSNGFGELEVTDRKDFKMEALYDDRCVQVETNTGRLLGKQKE